MQPYYKLYRRGDVKQVRNSMIFIDLKSIYENVCFSLYYIEDWHTEVAGIVILNICEIRVWLLLDTRPHHFSMHDVDLILFGLP